MAKPEPLPPHDKDAERSVVGSVLIDSQAMIRLATLVDAKDFFGEDTRLAFAACVTLHERNEAINLITVAAELGRTGGLEQGADPVFLSECVAAVPTSLHAEHYARIVKHTATMRALIQAGGQIVRLGYESAADLEKTLADAEGLVYGLRQGQTTRGFVHLSSVLEECGVEMARPLRERGEGASVTTGYSDLDGILGGLHASDLVVLAARPSMGKSALALNVAEHAALDGARVGIFSLEMSREQLAHRLLASNAGIDLQRLRLGRLSDTETRRMVESMGVLSELAVWIDDMPGQRVTEVRAKARRLAERHGLDLVILDYIGLARGTGRSEGRVQEVGEISRGLKGLARELDLPVLVCAQLNRQSELRPDHRPQLSDLRESGDIEQDADVVLFIFRQDRYIDEDDWTRKHPTRPYPKGIAEIIVAKHRNGPTGGCRLLFRDQSARFDSLSHRQEEPGWWAE